MTLTLVGCVRLILLTPLFSAVAPIIVPLCVVGCEPNQHLDRRSTMVGTESGTGVKADGCTRALGCQCVQCNDSAAAVLDVKDVNPSELRLI